MRDEAKTTVEAAVPPLRMLLVEDDEFDAAVFNRAFRQNDVPCEIVRCRTGEEALEGLRDAELELDLPGDPITSSPGFRALSCARR